MKDLWAQPRDPAAVASLVPSHQVPWQQEAPGHAAAPILQYIKHIYIHHISYDKFLNMYHMKISTHQNILENLIYL